MFVREISIFVNAKFNMILLKTYIFFHFYVSVIAINGVIQCVKNFIFQKKNTIGHQRSASR